MELKTPALFFWVFLIAANAITSEEQRTRIEIEAGQGCFADSVDVRAVENEHMHDRHETNATQRDADATDELPLVQPVS